VRHGGVCKLTVVYFERKVDAQMKKIMVLMISAVFFLGSVGLIGCQKKEKASDEATMGEKQEQAKSTETPAEKPEDQKPKDHPAH